MKANTYEYIRGGKITVIRRANTGWNPTGVIMQGNDGRNGFIVRSTSVRRCRVLAKKIGIKFPRAA